MEASDILNGKYELPLELDAIVTDLVELTKSRLEPFTTEELINLLTFFKPFQLKYCWRYIDELGFHAYEKVFIPKMTHKIKSIILENRAEEAMESVNFNHGKNLWSDDDKGWVKAKWNKKLPKESISSHSVDTIKS